MAEHLVMLSTAPSIEEGKRLAEELLKRKLVACVNLIPHIRSLYWWEGRIEESDEVLIVAKTREELAREIISLVKELHSYEVPEVVFLPVEGGSPDYLRWIDESTGRSGPFSRREDERVGALMRRQSTRRCGLL